MRSLRPPLSAQGLLSPAYFYLLGLCLLLLQPVRASEPLQIFVSVLPQKHFVEQVGGDQVKAESLVQPGFSPETFEPTARQIAGLAQAEAYIRVGMPFEEAWMPRIQAVNPKMLIIDARDGLALQTMAAHSHAQGEAVQTDHSAEDDHGDARHEETDAHIWTSPLNALHMAAQLRDTLSQLRPEAADRFEQNYQHFASELSALDSELTQLFADKPEQAFMVFHPAWGYLAAAYHLQQIPIESEGKEPGAKAITGLITEAKQLGVKVIFTQPQFDPRAARQIAKAIDGKVVAIDPLAEDYIDNLRHTARLIAGVADE